MTGSFFDDRQGAAAMKHALLKRYLPKFVGMTGSTSSGGIVYYIDGFAGPGAYESGEPGSPTIALDLSLNMFRLGRNLKGICIEPKAEHFGDLRDLLSDVEGWEAWQGTAEAMVPSALTKAGNAPVFVFLDPYGLKDVPFSLIEGVLARTGTTELLLRVDSSGIKRFAGNVMSSKGLPATTDQGDRFFGGEWWQEHAPVGGEEMIQICLDGYARRLKNASGCGWFWFPVWDRLDARTPKYYLMHFAWHPAAHWHMNEVLSLWREEVTSAEPVEQADLFDNVESWQLEIRDNVIDLLDDKGSFVIRKNLSSFYGSTLGKARTKHARPVLKQMYQDGGISTTPVGETDLGAMRISR